ncbi:hypothetical protein HPB51_000351 [Rhipicephalus microplus]|uniref:PiggyBac transposable element-derived protein domain-containing protein n=1 Tax=Rhipicephalus microplus TaxID=6941 RepID=A0A9J6D3L1_RHIMP|nr:hypothetical protein HPB51_000351 [Rhipicephalus microplus]
MNRSPASSRQRSPEDQRINPVEVTPVHQRASRRLRGDSPECSFLHFTPRGNQTMDATTMTSQSDDSDLDSSSDEEPENAVLARTTPQTDSEDEEVSEAPSAGSIDNAFGEIPKPSKDSPTWKAVRSSSSNAMREWKDVPPYPSPVESPINYLRNCFDVTFLSHICEQSSLYSAQRNPNKVTSMTVNDLEQFIGTVLTMSLIKLPQTRMYWSQRFRVSQVADTMTRDRWEEIKQSLHFSDNQEAPDQNDPERDRLYKVRPLLDHLVAKCHEIPKSQKLCVDEQLVPFKGRSSLKQYLLNKAKKWGSSPEPAVKRFDKKTRTTVSVPRPAIIGIYNECMGGVDLLDMLVALYRIHVRSKKVYRRLFFHLLDVVVVNCWLLYLRDATAANVPCKHQMTLLTFKADIACALRQQGKVSTPSRK